MADFGLTAEFHELGMDAAWARLMPQLQEMVTKRGEGSPRRVLEIGAGSGMGLVRLAELWPDADLVVIEPDRTMRSMLMGRLAADRRLRERTTVLTLPVAPGTTIALRDQLDGEFDLVLSAHMAGILEPVELTALMNLTAGALSPEGVAVITYTMPHSDSGDKTVPPELHVEEQALGRHTIRGTYQRSEEEFRVRYEQLDAHGAVLRSAIRSRRGPLRKPVGEEGLSRAAATSGLAPDLELSWPGGLVLRVAAAPSSTSHPAPQPTGGWEQLCHAHTRRLQAADPKLGPIPPAADEPVDVLGVDNADGSVWGILRRTVVAADDPISLWGPTTREILQIRTATTPHPEAVKGLLDRWLTRVDAEGETGSGDRGAIVRVPVAETGLARPLLAAGFAPQTTTAILPVHSWMAETPTPADLSLRPPEQADRDALLDLAEEMLASDIAAGSAWPRPHGRGLMAHYVDEMLGYGEGWAYVAEDEEGLTGVVSLNPPEQSEWAAPSTSLSPVVYLGMAAVTERVRRQGVGRRLVSAVHQQAAVTGQQAILLDHACLSPLSAPFWQRHGYRPLWTTWLRPV